MMYGIVTMGVSAVVSMGVWANLLASNNPITPARPTTNGWGSLILFSNGMECVMVNNNYHIWHEDLTGIKLYTLVASKSFG